MARYIDADELKKQIDLVQILVMGGRLQGKSLLNETMETYKKAILKKIDEQPTADVVPKSEVERLEYDKQILFDEGEAWHKKAKDLEVELKAMRGAANSYKMLYEKSKAEFVREIFAEIEFDIHQLMFVRDEIRAIAIEGVIAELKKKYTEVQT